MCIRDRCNSWWLSFNYKIGDKEYQADLKVLSDPRFELNTEGIKKQYTVVGDLIKTNYLYAKALTASRNIIRSIDSVISDANKIEDQKKKAAIIEEVNKFKKISGRCLIYI
jgi:hypothetical protein